MTEAVVEKRIPASVQEVVLEITEGGFAGKIGSVRWQTGADGGLQVTAVAGGYGADLVNGFADVQKEFAQKGVVLSLTPESHMDRLRPGEFCVQLTPQID